MRIRGAEFAMVPTWVLTAEGMRGQAVRIAVYVGVRLLAFENPDREWASERDIAADIGTCIGIPAETCRKHLRGMRDIGVITGDSRELIAPNDDPRGSVENHGGSLENQTGSVAPHTPITKKREVKSLPRTASEDDGFDAFWALYPRHVEKKAARNAWTRAIQRASVQVIMGGLARRCDWWSECGTATTHIPHPASWLNGDRWDDEIEPVMRPSVRSNNPALDATTDDLMKHLRTWFFTSNERGVWWNLHKGPLRGAVHTALAQGYQFGEIAVRVALAWKGKRAKLELDVAVNFVLCREMDPAVSRFTGGAEDVKLYGMEPTYVALMERAFEVGSWRLKEALR